MRTDREMLELAAKAAGVAGEWCEFTLRLSGVKINGIGDTRRFVAMRDKPWNPLANDGDALRLAVALRIEISFPSCTKEVWAGIGDVLPAEDLYPDPWAATRRAIVRAAAEIGAAL